MSMESVVNGINTLNYRMLNGNVQQAQQVAEQIKEQLTRFAKQVAKDEFMYKLRGDNKQINLEQVASLRDQGARELSKSA